MIDRFTFWHKAGTIHHERNKLHGSSPNACWDISLTNTIINLVVTLEYRASPNLVGFILWVCTKCCAKPSSRYWGFSLDKWRLEDRLKQGSARVLEFILWGPWISVPNPIPQYEASIRNTVYQLAPIWFMLWLRRWPMSHIGVWVWMVIHRNTVCFV